MKRILLWAVAVVAGYFVFGIILHNFVFPQAKPDYANYFKAGDKFQSKSEGFNQTILAVNDGWVHLSLEVKPKASGPPVHIHENFDETFTVKEGELSLLVNGEKRTLKAGETFTIPRGTPHKPFNETDQSVVVESRDNVKTMPAEFAYHLSQIYPLVDSLGENPSNLKMIMQFSVYGNEMDSWLADAPPIKLQKAMRHLLAPTARLAGYKNYYEEYRIN